MICGKLWDVCSKTDTNETAPINYLACIMHSMESPANHVIVNSCGVSAHACANSRSRASFTCTDIRPIGTVTLKCTSDKKYHNVIKK